MRRIAFFCLTIAALSTTIITAGTESALATKPNKDVVTKKDLVAKKDLVTKKDLAAKTDKAPGTTTDKRAATKADNAPAAKINKTNTLVATLAAKTGKATAAKTNKILVATTDKTNSTSPAASSSDLVIEAKRWMGTNPTGWDHVWCARFMNFVLKRTGHAGTGSDAASSFATYGRRVWWPQVGAIAVMTRGKNGGHVGVVSGFDHSGNPIIISGNHNKRVGVGVYPRERVYAYVVPN
jgi:uncharacterized protein (TIGR02594 family)